MAKLADGFGLLHLPKMPELKGKQVSGFLKFDVDIKSIRYRDKTREKQRQVKIIKEQLEPKEFVRKEPSWSKDKEKKTKKEIRKLKRENSKRKRENLKHSFDDNDLDELSKEVGLMKKLKRGKITKEQFDKEVHDSNEDSE